MVEQDDNPVQDSRIRPGARRVVRGLLLSALALGLLVGESRAKGETFEASDVARIRTVTRARIAPDGSTIAYLLSVPRPPLEKDSGPAWVELHIVGADGVSRPFITGEVNIASIEWAPDGSSITFLDKRGKDPHRSLYSIPLRGGEARKLLSHDEDIVDYALSPDGKRVAFLAREPEPEERKKEKEKGFDRIIYEEELRPVRAWVADLAPQDSDSKPVAFDLEGSASEIEWSPAGGKLALALAPTPLVDDGYMNKRVHVVDADSGSVLARFENPGKLGDLAWSPDGKHLAMISAADLNDPSAGRLLVGSAEGGELRDLLPGFRTRDVVAIAWQSPQAVMLVGHDGVSSFLGKVALDGSGFHPIYSADQPILLGIHLCADGSSGVFPAQGPAHPTEVFAMKHGDDAPRRVTHSNPWLDEMELAPQEVISFQARDGLELQGILIRPFHQEAGLRYPLILTVHGGPESHYSNGWLTSYSQAGQVGAAKGFAVFYPNYRGSTGRGVEFSKLGQADAAGKEFDDLIDAVDHLVATGLVDRDRVGITGGSYGGYASAWGATYYSDRFAASVMFVGISDNISKTGTTDIPYEMYCVHHRKWLPDDWEYFLERSPIYHVKKNRTPTLILHGKDDPRVHPSQSLELYRQLKLHGSAPVRLVLYPGEGHGNRKSASRFDYNLRMIRWMEHYLQGEGGSPPPTEIAYESFLSVETPED